MPRKKRLAWGEVEREGVCPSPAEIKAACERIREKWTEDDYVERSTHLPAAVNPALLTNRSARGTIH